MEDNNLSDNRLVWSSSIDGYIGTGSAVNAARLSSGNHTITLEATDTNGASSSASVSIMILP